MDWSIKSLCSIEEAGSYLVNSIHLSITVQRKLRGVGLTPGVKMNLLSGSKQNNYLVELNNSPITLDWETVKGIRVKVNN